MNNEELARELLKVARNLVSARYNFQWPKAGRLYIGPIGDWDFKNDVPRLDEATQVKYARKLARFLKKKIKETLVDDSVTDENMFDLYDLEEVIDSLDKARNSSTVQDAIEDLHQWASKNKVYLGI